MKYSNWAIALWKTWFFISDTGDINLDDNLEPSSYLTYWLWSFQLVCGQFNNIMFLFVINASTSCASGLWLIYCSPSLVLLRCRLLVNLERCYYTLIQRLNYACNIGRKEHQSHVASGGHYWNFRNHVR